MTSQELLQRYDEGILTATDVMLTVLCLTDKRAVTQALELLPQEVLRKTKDYVDRYRPGLRVFRGPRPKIRTVRFVKHWFASAPRLVEARVGSANSLLDRSDGQLRSGPGRS